MRLMRGIVFGLAVELIVGGALFAVAAMFYAVCAR